MIIKFNDIDIHAVIHNFDECMAVSLEKFTKKQIEQAFSYSFDGEMFCIPMEFLNQFKKDYENYLISKEKSLEKLALSDEGVGAMIFIKKAKDQFIVIDPHLDSMVDEQLLPSRFIFEWIERNKIKNIYHISEAHLFDNMNFFKNEDFDDIKFFDLYKKNILKKDFLWNQLFVIENSMPCDICELDAQCIEDSKEDFPKNLIPVMSKLLDLKEKYKSIMLLGNFSVPTIDIKTFLESSCEIKVSHSIKKELSLLLVDTINPENKFQQAATQLGVKIMTDDDFLNDIFSNLHQEKNPQNRMKR